MNYVNIPAQKNPLQDLDNAVQTIAFNPKMLATTGGLSGIVGAGSIIGEKLRTSQVDELGVGAETGRGKLTRGLGTILNPLNSFKNNKYETKARKTILAIPGLRTISNFLGGGKQARNKLREERKRLKQDEMNSINTNNIIQQANALYTPAYKEGGLINDSLYLTLIRLKVKVPKNEKVFTYKKGGTLPNKISDGVSHGRKNNIKRDDITKKGVPVLNSDDEQYAEIENNEFILSKDNNDKLEELKNFTTIKGAIKLGRWFKKQLLEQTEDSKSKLLC